MAFRFLAAGESHGEALTAVIDGVPFDLRQTTDHINEDLARRQRRYGRGGRMKIERGQVHISSGVRFGLTLGSPISLTIQNRDWENWLKPTPRSVSLSARWMWRPGRPSRPGSSAATSARSRRRGSSGSPDGDRAGRSLHREVRRRQR